MLTASVLSFFSIPFSGSPVRPLRPQAHLHARRGATGVFGFVYFGLLDTAPPALVFLAISLSLIPHDMMYGPQAALIAECFTGRLRYSGASLGYQLSSIFAGGPAPLIATWLFSRVPVRAPRSRSSSWLRDRQLRGGLPAAGLHQ